MDIATVDERDNENDEDDKVEGAKILVEAMLKATSTSSKSQASSVLALRSAKVQGEVMATIDIVCSVMDSTPYSVIATKDLNKKINGLAVLRNMAGAYTDKEHVTIRDVWVEVVEPTLSSHRKEAEVAMTAQMSGLANVHKNLTLREAYQRKGSMRIDGSGASGNGHELYSGGTRAQELAKNQVIVTFAVLASKHIQRRIHDHTGIELDFLAIVLQNAKGSILRACTFIWGCTRGPNILTNEPQKVKVSELCDKLLTLLEGACNGDKKMEYEAKKVAHAVETESYEILARIEEATRFTN